MPRADDLLAALTPCGPTEVADLDRARSLVDAHPDPWARTLPLHLTASSLIVHPASRRVLLRWHRRQQAWLQVGGHADPGEHDPLTVALREGREETGLADLAPWPDARLLHLVVVPVAARADEPAHEHADLRFVLATGTPEDVTPEDEHAPLRWLEPAQAGRLTSEPNLRESLARAERLFGTDESAAPSRSARS